jgi:hypothetical protein
VDFLDNNLKEENMAFLDNSGDIILDAVLTDAGRQRMARGEFKIVKFAFCDEEINYTTYNGNHESGSAFADLEIMQTPILESFTNNTSLMKTKLISINRNNILYMPIFRLNNKSANGAEVHASNAGFYLSANTNTDNKTDFNTAGVLPFNTAKVIKTEHIYIDQGLDTGGNPAINSPIPADLMETAFLIRLDHRLLRLHRGIEGYSALSNSFVDDDSIASYYVSSTDAAVEPPIGPRDYNADDVADGTPTAREMFDGPLGNRLKLFLRSSTSLQSSDALFDELGTAVGNDTGFPLLAGQTVASYKHIDTVVNVVGVTSGYSIDIPVRILRTPN